MNSLEHDFVVVDHVDEPEEENTPNVNNKAPGGVATTGLKSGAPLKKSPRANNKSAVLALTKSPNLSDTRGPAGLGGGVASTGDAGGAGGLGTRGLADGIGIAGIGTHSDGVQVAGHAKGRVHGRARHSNSNEGFANGLGVGGMGSGGGMGRNDGDSGVANIFGTGSGGTGAGSLVASNDITRRKPNEGFAKRKPKTRVRGSMKSRLAKIDDPIDTKKLKRTLKKRGTAFRACYDKALERNERLKGKVKMSFDVNERGRVTRANVIKSSAQDANLHNCLTKSFKRLRFPKPEDGAVEVSYTMVFQPRSVDTSPTPQKPLAQPDIFEPQPDRYLLTAGDWDDNLNYARFKNYVEDFKSYAESFAGEAPFSNVNLTLPRRAPKHVNAVKEPASQTKKLDLVFLLDSTGSMNDELGFIKNEARFISRALEKNFPDLSLRIAAVLYKTKSSQFITDTLPFQKSVKDFENQMVTVRAGGGGEEEMVAGLEAMNTLDFRSDAKKVVFMFADEAAVRGTEQALLSQAQSAYQNHVTIYPVASSGVDKLTEFELRVIAQQSGGRYIFLTDDSGVGGHHAEPTIPCYHVRKLKQVMIDTLQYEMTGQYVLPDAKHIIRSAGNPANGECKIKEQRLCIRPTSCVEAF